MEEENSGRAMRIPSVWRSNSNNSKNSNNNSKTVSGGTGMAGGQTDSSSSEDSSYDSDYCCEASEDSSSLHCDVSRTVSDTLAQEFNEYVSSTDIKNEYEEADSNHMKIDSNYTAKVEFARKLGYTEDQVKIALAKLGQAATQNELLAELIQLDIGSGGAVGGLSNPTILLQPPEQPPNKLRPIVIDGSNVAMSHGSNKVFSSHGIRIAVDYFRSRGHKEITVFVPMYRKEHSAEDPVSDPKILTDLESDGILVWTPSKRINNRRMVCYDDRYILKLAAETEGIVVSNDNYRDLTAESSDFRRVVEERTLMYSFVNDRFMPPEDPLGRHGPTLDQFLRWNTPPLRSWKQIPCPYGRKCTYGTKCKYYHTTQKVSVSEALRKQAAMKTTSLPILRHQEVSLSKVTCQRTKSAVINSTSLHLAPSGSSELLAFGNQNNSSSNNNNNSNNYTTPTKSLLTSSQSCGGQSSSGSSGTISANSSSGAVNGTVNGHRKLQRVHSVNPAALPQFSQKSSGSGCQTQNISSKNHLLPPAATESRSQIFHNLAAIFPEERVRHVMTLYPLENDPQVICRLILDIFK